MNRNVSDDEFIYMMQLWVYKKGTYPLELITFLNDNSGKKYIAIPDYCNPESSLYLDAKSYVTYQSALTKVGALMDKMNYPKALNEYKSSHPLSCPEFFCGYEGIVKINPYESEMERAEWDSGRAYRIEQGN